LDQAERLTELFLNHYHHAVPFDRGVIEAVWQRCLGDECEARQRDAWQRLSSLTGDTSNVLRSVAPSEPGSSGQAWNGAKDDEENGEVD
jgi:hypothetical protein